MTQLLKQNKAVPYPLADQVAIFWVGGHGYLDTLHPQDVVAFEKKFLDYMHAKHSKLMKEITSKKVVDEALEGEIKQATESFMKLEYSA